MYIVYCISIYAYLYISIYIYMCVLHMYIDILYTNIYCTYMTQVLTCRI